MDENIKEFCDSVTETHFKMLGLIEKNKNNPDILVDIAMALIIINRDCLEMIEGLDP